ncbi:jg5963 [Pararge aegeria aegeria]|uniref:Jg5963 protein n=1 Tax=Pararge aegeria aegeria TaxID=348720 RepID=A0A8S4RFC8_9NEOP|nr:jg5963 [Pararge aegeria aegeria]
MRNEWQENTSIVSKERSEVHYRGGVPCSARLSGGFGSDQAIDDGTQHALGGQNLGESAVNTQVNLVRSLILVGLSRDTQSFKWEQVPHNYSVSPQRSGMRQGFSPYKKMKGPLQNTGLAGPVGVL